uniref:Uncharacterized protein n=1 Tax=Arundo donax TaxID=35708 RepID=A0A0A9F289_ARUDO
MQSYFYFTNIIFYNNLFYLFFNDGCNADIFNIRFKPSNMIFMICPYGCKIQSLTWSRARFFFIISFTTL